MLGTDYENYSVVYNCVESFGGRVSTTVLWIMSRTATLQGDKLNEA